ncbi:hypothetical protein HHA01_12510 [Halomonas halmophila]|uniref:Uncharacterized protein n=1 Tax=Halomonas halmophila TaxID=252 RepID=A0A4Y4F350_9GAMM|nr:hypothetical protein HHA01_12510 [Halomonas halmophila]
MLEQTSESALPLTYRQMTEVLGLTPPRTIQRLTDALEVLMRDDVANGRPMVAALVISQRGEGLPAAGFFELAAELGRLPVDPALQAEAYRAEYQRALAARA